VRRHFRGLRLLWQYHWFRSLREVACSTTAVQGLCWPPEERGIASPALALTREAMHLKSCITWVNGATAFQRAAVDVAVSLVPVTARSGL